MKERLIHPSMEGLAYEFDVPGPTSVTIRNETGLAVLAKLDTKVHPDGERELVVVMRLTKEQLEELAALQARAENAAGEP